MNRDELLKFIGYRGKYTKDVKKKLNKLLKKYHPDNNKSDKNTILLLYKIKKEIENGNVVYENNKTVRKEEKEDNISNNYIYLLKNMLSKLMRKKRRSTLKLEALYRKLNFHYKKLNNKQDELSYIEMNISEEKEALNKLLKCDIVDIIIILSIVISLFVLITNKKIHFLLVIFILLLGEFYYVYGRKKRYNEAERKLKQSLTVQRHVDEEFLDISDKVLALEKDEKMIKADINKINNDIQYYNHELSSIREKSYDNKNEYNYEGEKSFFKNR